MTENVLSADDEVAGMQRNNEMDFLTSDNILCTATSWEDTMRAICDTLEGVPFSNKDCSTKSSVWSLTAS